MADPLRINNWPRGTTDPAYGDLSPPESLGIGEATAVAELEVTWPTKRTTQTFRLAADRSIEITGGVEGYRPLGPPGRAATAR